MTRKRQQPTAALSAEAVVHTFCGPSSCNVRGALAIIGTGLGAIAYYVVFDEAHGTTLAAGALVGLGGLVGYKLGFPVPSGDVLGGGQGRRPRERAGSPWVTSRAHGKPNAPNRRKDKVMGAKEAAAFFEANYKTLAGGHFTSDIHINQNYSGGMTHLAIVLGEILQHLESLDANVRQLNDRLAALARGPEA